MTSLQNFLKVKSGCSALARHSFKPYFNEPITASLFSQSQIDDLMVEGLTRFESLAYQSAKCAIEQVNTLIRKEKTLFVLSTTKGNVERLVENGIDDSEVLPAESATKIAKALGLETQPIVVSNACSSGVSAILLAKRMLDQGLCQFVVVCGADVQSLFTIAGFKSLNALSDEPCRPFDLERTGLNLGEAAATMVLMKESEDAHLSEEGRWHIVNGYIRNDAFHLSSSSQQAVGSTMALECLKNDTQTEQVAFINAHGTATLFNDQMEAMAIKNAGLLDLPVNALKAHFGHTMGAAGILETILSMMAVDEHVILPTKGFQEVGVSAPLKMTPIINSTNKTAFIKMISGFGGVNAVLLMSKSANHSYEDGCLCQLKTLHHMRITPREAFFDDKAVATVSDTDNIITYLYKSYMNDYPKFYKMDKLARLGFVAAQMLIIKEMKTDEQHENERAVMLFNHSSSICADLCFLESIKDKVHFFPSPSAFIYTLPNVVAGEIAIKNHYHGETGFFVLDSKNMQLIYDVVLSSMSNADMESVIFGWVNYEDENNFEADLFLSKLIRDTNNSKSK